MLQAATDRPIFFSNRVIGTTFPLIVSFIYSGFSDIPIFR